MRAWFLPKAPQPTQVLDQRLEFCTGDLERKVLRPGRIRGDVGQVHLGLLRGGKLDLGFFSGFFQALQGQHVFGQIDALFLLELGDDVVDDALVEVFATQEGVAVGGQHFKLLFAVHVCDFDDGHVKGATAQVVHRYLAGTLLVHAREIGKPGVPFRHRPHTDIHLTLGDRLLVVRAGLASPRGRVHGPGRRADSHEHAQRAQPGQ